MGKVLTSFQNLGILFAESSNVEFFIQQGMKQNKITNEKPGNYCTRIKLLFEPAHVWYLSHRRPAKAQASLHIHAVSSELSPFAYMKYGKR